MNIYEPAGVYKRSLYHISTLHHVCMYIHINIYTHMNIYVCEYTHMYMSPIVYGKEACITAQQKYDIDTYST